MSYIPVRLGDLVKHNIYDYGIGLVVECNRTFLIVQWLQHPTTLNRSSHSPKAIHTVKIAREQNEV